MGRYAAATLQARRVAEMRRHIPPELKLLTQWVALPYTSPAVGSASRLQHIPQVSFDEAVAASLPGAGRVALVLSSKDPYAAVCLTNAPRKTRRHWLAQYSIIDAIDSYTEIMPNGYLIVVEGCVPKTTRTMTIELFDRDVYITLTGDAIRGHKIKEGQARLDDLYSELQWNPNALIIEDEQLSLAREHRSDAYQHCEHLIRGLLDELFSHPSPRRYSRRVPEMYVHRKVLGERTLGTNIDSMTIIRDIIDAMILNEELVCVAPKTQAEKVAVNNGLMPRVLMVGPKWRAAHSGPQNP